MLLTIDTFFDNLDLFSIGKAQTVQVIVAHIFSSRCVSSPAQPAGAGPDRAVPPSTGPTLIATNPCKLLRIIGTELKDGSIGRPQVCIKMSKGRTSSLLIRQLAGQHTDFPTELGLPLELFANLTEIFCSL